MLVSGYFRLPHDIPKPVWRYPMSYISFHFWALQVTEETHFNSRKPCAIIVSKFDDENNENCFRVSTRMI